MIFAKILSSENLANFSKMQEPPSAVGYHIEIAKFYKLTSVEACRIYRSLSRVDCFSAAKLQLQTARSRQEFSNEFLVAKISVGTAGNEPSKKCLFSVPIAEEVARQFFQRVQDSFHFDLRSLDCCLE